jgi:hypothetical protein
MGTIITIESLPSLLQDKDREVARFVAQTVWVSTKVSQLQMEHWISKKENNMGPDTYGSCARYVPIGVRPLLQHYGMSIRAHEQRIVLSLNRGFHQGSFTYVYPGPVSTSGRFWECGTPRPEMWQVVARESPWDVDQSNILVLNTTVGVWEGCLD